MKILVVFLVVAAIIAIVYFAGKGKSKSLGESNGGNNSSSKRTPGEKANQE